MTELNLRDISALGLMIADLKASVEMRDSENMKVQTKCDDSV